MKERIFIFISLILPFLVSAQPTTQSVIGSAGERLKAADGRSLSFTMGEIAVETYQLNNKQLTQGFHQVFPANTVDAPIEEKLSFYIEESIVLPGQTVEIPVKVRNFKNIGGFSFSINNSNSALAGIQGIGSVYLPNSTGFVASTLGDAFVCLWSLPGDIGLSLEDDFTIFTIRLSGWAGSDCAELIFENTPVGIDVLQKVNGLTTSIEATFQGGKVCLNDSASAISGLILDTEGVQVRDVKVQLIGLDDSAITQEDGIYRFSGLQAGQNYIIAPGKAGVAKDRISLVDIQAIDNHVKGIRLLDDPYQIIAADVNQSNSVTLEDVLLLQQMFLGLISEFPNNKGWRFIPAKFTFADPQNPFSESIPEAISSNEISDPTKDCDFIAVRLGDLANLQNAGSSGSAALKAKTPVLFNSDQGVQLRQNYPNPFSYNTTISWTLPQSMRAKISIYDTMGKTIKTYEKEFDAGLNELSLPADLFPAAGIYFYTLETQNFRQIKKMILKNNE